MNDNERLFKETLWEKIFKHANYYEEADIIGVALHEAGHSLIGELVYPGCVKRVAISAVPTPGHALACKISGMIENLEYRINGEDKKVSYKAGAYGVTDISDDIFEDEHYNKAMVAIAGYLTTENIQYSGFEGTLGKGGCGSDFDMLHSAIINIRDNGNKNKSLDEIKEGIEKKVTELIEENKEGIIRLAEELVKRKRINKTEVRKLLGLGEENKRIERRHGIV